MKTYLALAAAAFVCTPAFAEPVWGKVDFGMSRADIEAAYPKGGKTHYNGNGTIEISDVIIIGKCQAETNIFFEGGIVSKLVINGNPSMGGRCSDDVLTALASKYGEPLSREATGGSFLAREGKIFVWNRPGGVTMRLKKFSNGEFGGGGLLKASWELTYTKVGSDISL